MEILSWHHMGRGSAWARQGRITCVQSKDHIGGNAKNRCELAIAIMSGWQGDQSSSGRASPKPLNAFSWKTMVRDLGPKSVHFGYIVRGAVPIISLSNR
jgi:hypothetical protein